MNIGIIGYGSMGKMLFEKFAGSGLVGDKELFVANRTAEKLAGLEERFSVCGSSAELARNADIIFLCVRPADMKNVLDEIKDSVKKDAFVVSLNGSIPFGLLEGILDNKLAKVIPSVTAEIDRSQTLVCCNRLVGEEDKRTLKRLLGCMGTVIELPENEMGMGSELVSCMPGFIASIFDVICRSAEKHTSIPKEQITEMVLGTMTATGELMLQKGMSFGEVVSRVATKGGITETGSAVIYDMFPAAADEMFAKTLEKRALTAEKAAQAFNK